MSDVTYHRVDVAAYLDGLSRRDRIAFGASCCQRLLGNYVAFRNETGWGDASQLQNALDVAWAYVDGVGRTSAEIRSLIAACVAEAPDSEDFDSLLVGPAQCAVFAVYNLLNYILDDDLLKIVQVSSHAIATVDEYVQEQEDMQPTSPDLEELIRLHPLMQAEIRHQLDDLSILKTSDGATDLRKRVRSRATSNLGL